MKTKPTAKLKDKKYILRRAKNGRRRERHISIAVYGKERDELQRLANIEAHKLGYRRMSLSAFGNLKLLLP